MTELLASPARRGRVLSAEQGLSFFFRRWKLMAFLFVVALIVIAIPALIIGSMYYRADMQILVVEDRSDPAVSAGQTMAGPAKNVTLDQVTSETELLTGRDIMEAVVATCQLANYNSSWRDLFHSSDPQAMHDRKTAAAVMALTKKIKAKTEFGSDLIDVSYGAAGSPEKSACVLRETARLYLAKHAGLQRPAGSSAFFTLTAEQSKGSLEKAEGNLNDFTRQIGEAPEILRTSLTQELAAQEAALMQVKETIVVDQEKIQLLKGKLNHTSERSPTTESSNTSVQLIQTLTADLVTAKNHRTALLLKYEPTYPLVKETDAEIAQISTALDEAKNANYTNKTTDVDPLYALLRIEGDRADTDLATQRTSQVAIEGDLVKLHAEIAQTDQNLVQEASLQREAKAAESSYLLYLAKRDQEITSDALDRKGVANVAIAVPPVVPALPAYGNSLILMLSVLMAGFVSLGSALIIDRTDSTFREPQQIEGSLGIPVLASLPRGQLSPPR